MSRTAPVLHHLICPTCGRSNVTEIATNWCLHGDRATPRRKQTQMVEALPLDDNTKETR